MAGLGKRFKPEQMVPAEIIPANMKKQIKEVHESQDDGLKKHQKELEEIKFATDRLYEAIEKGYLPLDSLLQEHAHKLHAMRQKLLINIARFHRQ